MLAGHRDERTTSSMKRKMRGSFQMVGWHGSEGKSNFLSFWSIVVNGAVGTGSGEQFQIDGPGFRCWNTGRICSFNSDQDLLCFWQQSRCQRRGKPFRGRGRLQAPAKQHWEGPAWGTYREGPGDHKENRVWAWLTENRILQLPIHQHRKQAQGNREDRGFSLYSPFRTHKPCFTIKPSK